MISRPTVEAVQQSVSSTIIIGNALPVQYAFRQTWSNFISEIQHFERDINLTLNIDMNASNAAYTEINGSFALKLMRRSMFFWLVICILL